MGRMESPGYPDPTSLTAPEVCGAADPPRAS